VVMADGVMVASGTPDQIRHNPHVHAIYLGRGGES
jgi:ABC-type branched-subunit amino acid transport system ATPase component